MRHLFVTVDYAPDLGGMARRHVELCRRLEPPLTVSTVSAPGAAHFDAGEPYRVERLPFDFRGARSGWNRWRWGRALAPLAVRSDVVHCGNMRPCGYPVLAVRRRTRVPYLVYVNGSDLLREQEKAAASRARRWFSRRLLADAAGIVANSAWTAALAGELRDSLGASGGGPVAAIDLGTDPEQFHPRHDRGTLRARLGWTGLPVALTVARLVPHKGHDVALRAVAQLAGEFPNLRYLIVGEGPHETTLRSLAAVLGIAERVVFAGAVSDAEITEAYATADVYLGLSRRIGVEVEGFGISFVEASASALPVIAGDSGGVRSAVRDGETGFVVPAEDVAAVAGALRLLLQDTERRRAMGAAGRRAVEAHYNWERVARETQAFATDVVRAHAGAGA